MDIDSSEVDREGRIEEESVCEDGRTREEGGGVVREMEGEVSQHQQPAILITARTETEKTAIYHSYSAPSRDAKGSYASIVRQHLAQYL